MRKDEPLSAVEKAARALRDSTAGVFWIGGLAVGLIGIAATVGATWATTQGAIGEVRRDVEDVRERGGPWAQDQIRAIDARADAQDNAIERLKTVTERLDAINERLQNRLERLEGRQ